MAQIYEATARREGKWWIITIPEIDAVTQARSIREIQTMADGIVMALLDLEEGEARVSVSIEMPNSVQEAWDEAARLQAESERASRRAAALRREAVRSLLHEAQLSQSEAGTLLGLSYQRIQQLARAS
ncbi:hypothetical protein D9V32_09215 [Mycetocola tolaasinivorans]|uniref:Antitoxin HicB n=1 Tax=Mycetocola tolaasinivorans TaxID=76635 RepID=A0A3L7A7S2_9MICO|nr:hypothetical protein [Mycetocola tolaasinivorans]RLP75641.1 hypothetical protein D9V32_09215 [Mycetocola tolaasinivorans]